jgi:large subunit ribosomal protein L4
MPRSAAVLGGGKVSLDPVAFEAPFNMALVHEAVRAEQNARRRGTASTRTRGEVSGGSSKPWRQKGTGRARAGSNRSPLWTGGGTVFGPAPRRYTVKVNRKARRGALRSALSAHAERGSIAVFDAAAFDAPSTKRAASLLTDWGASEPVLVLLGAAEEAAGKSFRNIPRVEAMPESDAGVADLVWAGSLLVSQAALPSLVARASARERDGDSPGAGAARGGDSAGGSPGAGAARGGDSAGDSPGAGAARGGDSAGGSAAEGSES